MRFLPLLLFVTFSFPSFSQNNELLRSRGLLPKNIIGTAQQQAAYEIKQRKSRNELITPDQLILINGTARLCEAVVASGRLMVNDSLSAYANKVLDILLKDDPALRKKLCVYCYYSEGTNAVTLDNGMIIIELGLMAHFDNEAQLAFVLSHEVSHYRENHLLKSLIYSQEIKNANDPISSVLSYSRDLEEEADSIGFEIYKKAGYPLSEAVVVFDVLKNSDMPEAQIPFAPSYFEHGFYRFPSEYFKDSISEVEKKTVDEKLSTHPSCDSRMDRMQGYIGELDPYGNYFLVSQSTFNALHLVAREECCSLYLESRDYGNAIYCAYVLWREDSTNVNAKILLGKGLHNLAAYNVSAAHSVVPVVFVNDYDQYNDFNFSSSTKYEPITAYQDVSGESQRLHYFFTEMSGTEIAILALEWNWKLYREGNFKDKVLGRMCKNLFRMLTGYYYFKPSDFGAEAGAERQSKLDAEREEAAGNDTIVPLTPEEKRRAYLEKRRSKSQVDKLSDAEIETILNDNGYFDDVSSGPAKKHLSHQVQYYYHGFDSLLSDSSFISAFTESAASHPFDNDWANAGRLGRGSAGLGIKNMYLMPPSYYYLREIKRTHNYRYDKTQSRASQKQAQDQLGVSGKSFKSGYFMITPQTMDSTRVNDYNTYCMLQQWLEEETSHSSNMLALNLSHAELADTLATKLGTQYVMISTFVCEKQKRIRNVGAFVLACVIPYTLPIAIIYGIVPKHRSQMESYVYDLKTGELVLIYEDYSKAKANVSRINMYYSKVLRKASKKK